MTMHVNLPRALVFATLLGAASLTLPTTSIAGTKADRWAVIDPAAGCVLARGKGVVSTTDLGTGLCQVTFDKNVSACEYNLTPGTKAPAGAPDGEGGVAPRAGNVNAVFTATFNSAGAAAELPFHVFVACK